MSERDLVRELKETIKDIAKDRDDALDKVKTKESRLKQTLIKLEHATDDTKACGRKIAEQNDKIVDLEAKLHAKDRLLDEALERIKSLTDDSTTESQPDTDDKELD